MPVMPKAKRPPWMGPPRKAWEHGRRWEGYNTRDWKKARLAFLIANNYKCAITPGCTRPASTVDHIKPISSGHDPWDQSNWQCGCGPCHKAKSSSEGGAATARGRNDKGGV